MASVTFILHNGHRTALEVRPGGSVMEAAVQAGIPGILGECGGSATCGTCHVYVENPDDAALPAIGMVEDEVLDATASPRLPGSRLSCQIIMTKSLDGLILQIPPAQ